MKTQTTNTQTDHNTKMELLNTILNTLKDGSIAFLNTKTVKIKVSTKFADILKGYSEKNFYRLVKEIGSILYNTKSKENLFNFSFATDRWKKCIIILSDSNTPLKTLRKIHLSEQPN